MSDAAEESHGSRVRLRIVEMGMRLWMVDPAFCTARRIASELNMTHGGVLYHFKHSKGLTDAIAYHAVQQGESRVIVHLIAMKHPHVAHFTEAQRMEHVRQVS